MAKVMVMWLQMILVYPPSFLQPLLGMSFFELFIHLILRLEIFANKRCFCI